VIDVGLLFAVVVVVATTSAVCVAPAVGCASKAAARGSGELDWDWKYRTNRWTSNGFEVVIANTRTSRIPQAAAPSTSGGGAISSISSLKRDQVEISMLGMITIHRRNNSGIQIQIRIPIRNSSLHSSDGSDQIRIG